jgi:ketosteroid isomerase-like protein
LSENIALTSFRVRASANHAGQPFLSVVGGILRGMTTYEGWQLAEDPNDLGRFFVERANAGDVEGVVALYEPEAVLTFPEGTVATGHEEIREVYEELLASRPVLPAGRQRPALVSGSLALTSTELVDGAVTVEIAHRQPEGFWLWAVDHPSL